MAQAATFTMPEGLEELRTILEADWPARQAALHASGVPLNDDDPPADPPADDPPDPKPADAKPPWGDDKDFDAPRAWKLIQDTRADRDKLKTERDDLRSKVKTHEDASKSDQEKAAERATAAEKTAAEATLESARLRVALKKGLTETQAKRLVGDSEEDLEKDADELLASFKTEGDGDGGGQGPRRRPTEKLRPGAAPGSEAEENDPEKLAASVPRMY